jgi:hypothetical protein
MLLRQEPYLRRGIQLSASPSHGCLQTWHMPKDQYGIIEARNVSLDSKARKLERSLWWRNPKCDRRQGDERDGRSLRRAVYAAHSPTLTLARISTAHFQHQTVDISRVTEIRSRRLPASLPPSDSPSHTTTMRPILLSGHERALTQVKYNADGDIIFSVSKDHVVCAWC